jgi:AcrR family transcriptional regulator
MAVATDKKQRLDGRTRDARAKRRDARQALLDAAAKVFVERGYRDATIDEIAAAAGYSKGAVYWHFDGKDDLFFALLDERVDRPMREAMEMLSSAPPERDMAPEATRLFGELFGGAREVLILDHEYWSLAVRDSRLRARYAKRQRQMRDTFARALEARAEHLGTPQAADNAEELATLLLSIARGLGREKLISPGDVPDHMLGEAFATIYAGLIARLAAG